MLVGRGDIFALQSLLCQFGRKSDVHYDLIYNVMSSQDGGHSLQLNAVMHRSIYKMQRAKRWQ